MMNGIINQADLCIHDIIELIIASCDEGVA